MIFSGTPGHYSQSIPLGGLNLLWWPFQLTNYTLTMTGGAGSVIVSGASSLTNSSFTLAGSTVVTNANMTMSHSYLAAAKIDGVASVVARNHSTITAGAAGQSESVVLKSSTLNVLGTGNWMAPVTMDGSSTVNLFGLPDFQPQFTVLSSTAKMGNLNVYGPISISGKMTVDANLVQHGTRGNNFINVINGGDLVIAGATPAGGDGINIGAGMLEFAPSPQFIHQPETSSEKFHASLGFSGLGPHVIQFDGISGALSINYNQTLDDLKVFNHGHTIADFHLAGPPSLYSAADFSVHGNQVLFSHPIG